MPTLTLIDGSGFIFRAYHALPHLSTTQGVPTHAVYGFTTMLLKALREHGPTHVALVFDASRKSFRTELDPAYKANRPEVPADLVPQFPLVRQVARALSVPVIEELGYEADDIIGTLACRAREQGFHVVIVTGDKDFAQLVDDQVELYDPMAQASGRGGRTTPAEVEQKLGVKPEQVVEYMTLLGDKVDNVAGIPGVGEVTAAALIRHFGTVENMLARADEIPQVVRRGGEKLKEKIVTHVDRLRLNRKLVELCCHMPIAFQPEEFARRPPDSEQVRILFTELEFFRLLKDLPASPPTTRPEQTELLFSRPQLDAVVAKARKAGSVGLRAVLDGKHPREERPTGIALAFQGKAYYLPLAHRYLGVPEQLGVDQAREGLRPLLEDEAVAKQTHHLKAEIHAFSHLGLEWRGGGCATELASHLLVPARREHDLADVVRERLACELPPLPGPEGGKRGAHSIWELPIEAVGNWAGSRTAVLPDLAAALERLLEEQGLGKLYREIERPLIPILAKMEQVGIAVDRGAMEAMSAEFGRAIRELEGRIHQLAGHPFNIASTRELGQVLFEELKLPVVKRLKTGPSTDQDVLEKLAEQHALPRLVIEHRGLSKLKGTYVDALPQLVDAQDGRIHTTFNQTGAATGRLSSQDPNLQNIPIRSELSRRIRAAFIAPPGRRLLSADYSQIELRILAHFAEDPALIESFRIGEDVHARTAAETFGVARDAVTPEMRRIAKVLNFGIAYGLSAYGLSKRLDLPPQEAQAMIDRYFVRYAAVRRWLDSAIATAGRDGEVRTLFGRKRELPEIRSRNPAQRQAAERMAVNTPIQGTAADIIKIAMIRVEAALGRSGLDARLLLQVHDELVFEVAEPQTGALESLVRQEMTAAVALRVPLEVEVGQGKSWDEAH